MPPATFKFDDTFAFVRPVQEGSTQVAYPFISNGERATKTYSRTLLQRAAHYVPAVLGFERDSVWAAGDPAAYLIAETSPEPTGIGDLVRFTRTYARIPAQQTVYGSRLIDRPVMHDITAGGYYAVSFDNGVTSHVFTSVSSVTTLTAGYAAAGYDDWTAITHAGHGAVQGDRYALWGNTSALWAFGRVVYVLDANSFYVANSDFTSPPVAGTYTGTGLKYALSKNAASRYVNGVANCSLKEVTDFYLPGVTSGITTPADIALVAPKLDPVSWLTAIQAGTAYLVCEGSQLSRWLGGPIYQQTTISVQMSDALDTVSVSA